MPFLRCLPCFGTDRDHVHPKREYHPTQRLKPRDERILAVSPDHDDIAHIADTKLQRADMRDVKHVADQEPDIKRTTLDIPKFKRDLKQEFVDTPDLKQWAASFLDQVIVQGFEATFREQVLTFAKFAESNQEDLLQHIEAWLRADKSINQYLPDNISTPLESKNQPLSERRPSKPVPGVDERDGKPVKVYYKEVFTNWTGMIQNVPRYTFVPRSKVGVINIVKFARCENLRVRVSGSRHSSSEIYGSSDEVLISLVDFDAVAAKSKTFRKWSTHSRDNELERIQFEGTGTSENGTQHTRVRLGAAVTSDQFRRWALNTRQGNWEWMLRALPILKDTTSAGWTQVMSHGAGISHKTISDLVIEVVIVNCRGELQVIRDKELLKAVAGGFGLLGVVVEQVFLLDPMRIAELFPKKVPTILGVPPVTRRDVPRNDDFDVSVSDEQLEEAGRSFERDCKKYYAEWLWFPFQPEVWINAWDTSPVAQGRPAYPDKKKVRSQKLQSAVVRIFKVSFLSLLPVKKQAELMGFATMQFLPAGYLVKTSVPDALHFRQGIHLLAARECEMEIEIPPRIDGTSDFSICQKAWWIAITEVYRSLPAAPMRTALEMRIVGGSDVTMSTQRGNDNGTCSIEVSTNRDVGDKEWSAFIERVTDRWAKLRNPMSGVPLRVRPHFAKEWPRRIKGMKIDNYLKAAYRNEIREFRDQLGITAEQGGYELEDAFKLFGNDTILDLVNSR